MEKVNMLSYNENMVDEMGVNEVTEEFQQMQERFGDDVAAHKAELGLESHESFSLDAFMTQDEQDMLNSAVEGTPEYKAALNQFKNRFIAHAWTELSANRKARAEDSTVDSEKVLDQMLDVQEKMTVLMKVIAPVQKAYENLDSWMKRFNTWKASKAYASYPNKGKAHKIFFAGLETRKEAFNEAKNKAGAPLAQLWSMWRGAKAVSDTIAKANPFVWTLYFNLVEEELNNYFTTGDTEDVDDFSLLANSQGDVADLLSYSHFVEMSTGEGLEWCPTEEQNGTAFWDLTGFVEARKASYEARNSNSTQDEEDFLLALMNSEPTI